MNLDQFINTDQIVNLVVGYLPTFTSHIVHTLIIFIIYKIFYNMCTKDGMIVGALIKKLNLKENDPIVTVCSKILRTFIVIIALITLAEEWGFDLGAVIVSLGIGSLALALAAQDTAKNLFGAFVILIEKPYTVGDKITAGGVTGVVKEINFRSTVIKLENGELVYVPNANISSANITNFNRQ